MVGASEEKASIDDLIVLLGGLEEQIKALRTKRDHYNGLMKTALNSRNESNQQISEHLDKAKEYANKRDNLNSQVKSLKKKRKELQQELSDKKKILNDLVDSEETVDKINIGRQRYKMKKINAEIQNIEWKLQTQVLTAEQEKELIQQAENLSEKLNEIGEKVSVTAQQAELWKEVSAIQKKINQIHTEIIDIAKESQVYHNMMNQNFSLVNDIRKRANKNHKKFIEHKKQGDNYHRELLAKVSEKNDTRKKLRILKKEVREERQAEIQNSLDEHVESAYKKYQEGENLSLDEFRLLVERGLI